jgi:hypothetical protein
MLEEPYLQNGMATPQLLFKIKCMYLEVVIVWEDSITNSTPITLVCSMSLCLSLNLSLSLSSRLFSHLWNWFSDKKRWKQLNPTGVAPKARHFHTAVVHDGSIWIFGGKSNGYMNDLFCLNLSIHFLFCSVLFCSFYIYISLSLLSNSKSDFNLQIDCW